MVYGGWGEDGDGIDGKERKRLGTVERQSAFAEMRAEPTHCEKEDSLSLFTPASDEKRSKKQ